MLKEFEKPISELESRWKRLLAMLEKLPEETLCKKPSGNEWSISQVCHHMLLAENGTAQAVSVRLEKEPQRVGFSAVVKHALLRLALVSGFKYKVPSKLVEPSDEISFAEIQKLRENAVVGWISALENLKPEQRNDYMFRHPYAGKLTAGQTLQFLIDHFDHHQPQIQRILVQLGSTELVH